MNLQKSINARQSHLPATNLKADFFDSLENPFPNN